MTTLSKLPKNIPKATGKEVIVEEVAREAYFDKLNTITANCGKDYDAFYAMSDFVPAYVAAEGLKDLNTFFEDPASSAPISTLKIIGMATSFFHLRWQDVCPSLRGRHCLAVVSQGPFRRSRYSTS